MRDRDRDDLLADIRRGSIRHTGDLVNEGEMIDVLELEAEGILFVDVDGGIELVA